MTTIQNVDLRLFLGEHPNTTGKAYQWKASADTGNDLSVVGFYDSLPEGETPLTPQDLPSEAEIIAWWDAYQAGPVAPEPMTVEELQAQIATLQDVVLESLLGGAL